MILLAAMVLASCSAGETPSTTPASDQSFNPDTLRIKDSGSVRKIRGQVLYVPIYSNVPCKSGKLFDLSAFIAIHNTDMKHPLRMTKVLYFNNDGKLVTDFLSQDLLLGPLAANNFYIPKKDQSGTGANFLVEWISDSPVSEPLIESVMIDCETHKSLSFLSQGKVIREIP